MPGTVSFHGSGSLTAVATPFNDGNTAKLGSMLADGLGIIRAVFEVVKDVPGALGDVLVDDSGGCG